MSDLTKTDLVREVAKASGESHAVVANVLDTIIKTTEQTLKGGGKVSITGFGTFEAPLKEAYEGRNPSSGETIQIPAARRPKFKVGKNFKANVN